MAIGLTTAELVDIRKDVDDLLPDTCTIRKVATVTNNIGSPVRTFTDRATSVSCRFDPVESLSLVGEERVSSMKNYIITEGQFHLTLKNGETIEETDQVVHGGVTYDVVHVDDDKSWQASVRVILNTLEH